MDRNNLQEVSLPQFAKSLPSRGAWIEILYWAKATMKAAVAPLAGSVDRNAERMEKQVKPWVAPLAGSVDRNWTNDRLEPKTCASLPSRGAWIEISSPFFWSG